MKITVAYASADQQAELVLDLPTGSCVADALTLACETPPFDGLDLTDPEQVAGLGVFNQLVQQDHILQAGDRVELYRPLVMDPMTARLLRAQRQS